MQGGLGQEAAQMSPGVYTMAETEELSVDFEERLAAMWNTVASVPAYMVLFRL